MAKDDEKPVSAGSAASVKSQNADTVALNDEPDYARVARVKTKGFTPEEFALLKRWTSAEDYAVLIALNREFLRCETSLVPYFIGNIWAETKPLVPGLMRLHDLGMLTVQSQPSKEAMSAQVGGWTLDTMSWTQISHRAFLSFVLPQHDRIPLANVERFLREMIVDKDFYVSIVNTDRLYGPKDKKYKPRTVMTCETAWSTHKEQKATEMEDIKNAEPRVLQCLNLGNHCCGRVSEWMGRVKTTKPLLIHVLATDWEEQDLIGLIEKAAARAGMKPVYKEDDRTEETLPKEDQPTSDESDERKSDNADADDLSGLVAKAAATTISS